MRPAACVRGFALLVTAFLAACGGATPAASTAPAASGGQASAKPAAPSAASARPAGAASASASASGAEIAPAKPGQILTAYAEVVASNSAVWGAKEAGLFQKRGLDVDMRLIESALSVSAVVSGQVHIAVVGGSETLAAAVEGADLRILAIINPVYPYKFEVGPAIKGTGELKGKKVGISRFGSSSDIATRVALRKLGLDAEKDVSIIPVGSTSARTAALLSGALDAGVASVPDNIKLEDAGFHPLLDLAAQDLPTTNVCIVVQGAWLNSHKNEMQRYIDAVVETIARIKRDKPFGLDVLRKYMKLEDQRLLDATYDYHIAKTMPTVPYVKQEAFKDPIEVLSQRNPRAREYDLNKLIDNSYLRSAADRGLDKG